MARELQVQTDIVRSVKAVGGYGLKLSNRFTIGVPDLGLWYPPFAPFTCEVKDFGEVTDKFDRQIEVTPKQRYTMRCMECYPFRPVTGVAVHVIFNKEHRLYLVPFNQPRLDYRARNFVVRKTGGLYDLRPLFESLGVPVI